MMDTTIAYVGLGSNKGDKRLCIQSAIERLSQTDGVQVIAQSLLYTSSALSLSGGQPDYLNAVAEIQTSLSPMDLLKVLHSIEIHLGRVRGEKWAARTIDLDLLLYGDRIIREATLCVPHPQLHLRNFVLDGLVQLCPQTVHPVFKQSMSVLAARLHGQNYFIDTAKPQLISIAGLIGVGKTTLTERLSGCLGGAAIYEEYDKNPYLAKVYAGQTELALQSELYFLSSSVRQLSADMLEAGRVYINDFVFEKAIIYAQSWLGEADLAEYRRLYQAHRQKISPPALVIYLQDTAENCLSRIHRRQRPFEQNIQTDFLLRLETWYNELFANWTACPVIRIGAGQCRMQSQVLDLAQEIKHYIAYEDKG